MNRQGPSSRPVPWSPTAEPCGRCVSLRGPRLTRSPRGARRFRGHKAMSRVPAKARLEPPESDGLSAEAAVSLLRDLASTAAGGTGPATTARSYSLAATSVHVETKLRLAEARYRTLVEQMPAITFMAALTEGINELYVSPQIEALLGFSQKEWLENPILWYTQLHPDDRERWHIEFARTCATGEHFRSEYRFLARDGRVVWIHGEAQVVRDAAGQPLFLQGIAFDITEKKRAEEMLYRLNAELERRVQERTAELERANLALASQAQELAHSNAELEQFAYVAS